MSHLQVFILGAPRSGTSIMFLCMRKVFGLPGRGESHVMPVFHRMLKEMDQHKERLKRHPNALANELDPAAFRESLAAFLRGFYGRHYPDGSWVDKTPGAENILAAEVIKHAFPAARLVVTKRTGIEMVQSYRSKFNAGMEAACRSWAGAMQALLWAQEHARDLLVIDQHDLTNSPQAVAEALCAHLGQPGRADELARFFLETRTEQRSSHDWRKRLTLADVDWSAQDRAIFLEHCAEPMRRLGYSM
jgi:Sulfotransferase family